MKFRPCIDLHMGKVKQIVGSTLNEENPEGLQENFTADKPSNWFAELYKNDNLRGGHIIQLGPGNEEAATEALAAWPGGMQIGGGINLDNCCQWLDRGASHVIVTSCVFKNGQVDYEYLDRLVAKIGGKRLVLDLSCRKKGDNYYIVTDRWQKFTDVVIEPSILEEFGSKCDEFLVHAADVEGKCQGIEVDLVEKLASWVTRPTTYAGGIKDLSDLESIQSLGRGQLDATVGSALDIFGGSGISYKEVVLFHEKHK
jgi:phosphoribosylformimino-5-aminoimidazole carboxamide ribotide isomerase